MGKRRNEDAQISKAEYARREAKPTQGGGAFPRADAATLAQRRLVSPFSSRDSRPLAREAYSTRIASLNKSFASFAETALTSTPKEAIVDAARDYVRYAEQLEARFLPKRTEVLSFGSGDCGQLAHSSTLEDENDTVVAKPRVVKALTNKVVAQLSCGGLHNVAVTLDGVCFTWGCNDEGSLGREGDESLLYMPGAVSLPEKVTCVAAGGSQTFAVTLSGKVYGWGCYKDKEGKQWFDAPGMISASPSRHRRDSCPRSDRFDRNAPRRHPRAEAQADHTLTDTFLKKHNKRGNWGRVQRRAHGEW
jgi:regulator of chromosome condensation